MDGQEPRGLPPLQFTPISNGANQCAGCCVPAVFVCLRGAQENPHLQVFVPVNKFDHIFLEKI